MRSFARLASFALVLSTLGFSACGGNVGDSGDTGGSSGAGNPQSGGQAVSGRASTGGRSGSTGGVMATGGTVGAGGAIATGGAAPTMGGCCNLLACPSGHQLVMNGTCPAGSECYLYQSCCQQVMCARPAATCNAIPVCDAGDHEITGECPPSVIACYSRTLCGTTIRCISESGAGGEGGAGGATCEPAAEYNRKYVATNPSTCQLIDYACPPATQGFQNACGCGCEQPGSCPEFVDCAPRVDTRPPDPLCADSGACPYTTRAY
jgi:hypothetical protein